MARIGLDTYFMMIAEVAKLRSTCLRRKVGAVFVTEGRIISTGYNGSPSRTHHCDEFIGNSPFTTGGCLMVDGHCIRSIHAEMNGILNASREGQSLKESTVYTTTYPCIRCLSAMRNAGIIRIVYMEPYKHSDTEIILFRELEPLFEWTKYEKA